MKSIKSFNMFFEAKASKVKVEKETEKEEKTTSKRSKKVEINHELIKLIEDFLKKSPEIVKDSELYPSESGMYQAHTIYDAIKDKGNSKFTKDDVRKTLRAENGEDIEWKHVEVRNDKLYSNKSPHMAYYNMYYWPGKFTKSQIDSKKKAYEKATLRDRYTKKK